MAGPTTLFQTGVHGSRPAASAGCVLYDCTTHSLIYRSDGSTWTTFASLGSVSTTIATDPIWTTSGKVAVATGTATATEQWPSGHEFTKTDVTSVVTLTNVAEASAPSIVSAGAVTYSGSDAVYIEWFLPQVYGPAAANADSVITLWEDSTDLGLVADIRSESTNRAVTSIAGQFKRTPTNASHNYTLKGHSTNASTGGAGGGAGGAGNLTAGFIRVVKA